MENIETIDQYINDNNYFDLDAFIKKYYGYVYMIVRNYKGINISEEDIEEIVSDVFYAALDCQHKKRYSHYRISSTELLKIY